MGDGVVGTSRSNDLASSHAPCAQRGAGQGGGVASVRRRGTRRAHRTFQERATLPAGGRRRLRVGWATLRSMWFRSTRAVECGVDLEHGFRGEPGPVAAAGNAEVSCRCRGGRRAGGAKGVADGGLDVGVDEPGVPVRGGGTDPAGWHAGVDGKRLDCPPELKFDHGRDAVPHGRYGLLGRASSTRSSTSTTVTSRASCCRSSARRPSWLRVSTPTWSASIARSRARAGRRSVPASSSSPVSRTRWAGRRRSRRVR